MNCPHLNENEPDQGEEQLLLEHCVHLFKEEAAGVLAALRMGALADETNARRLYWRRAIQRLEAQYEYLSALSIDPSVSTRVDHCLERLCRSIACWQDLRQSKFLILNLEEFTVSGRLARRLSVITAELVLNGFRHALERRATYLRVILRRAPASVVLVVTDNGPGCAVDRPPGSGPGLRLTSRLTRKAGGTIFFGTETIGTLIKVTLPIG